jgi:hypothetical protein
MTKQHGSAGAAVLAKRFGFMNGQPLTDRAKRRGSQIGTPEFESDHLRPKPPVGCCYCYILSRIVISGSSKTIGDVAVARLFISHSSANDAAAIALCEWLSEQGFSDVFLDVVGSGKVGLEADRFGEGRGWVAMRVLNSARNSCAADWSGVGMVLRSISNRDRTSCQSRIVPHWEGTGKP